MKVIKNFIDSTNLVLLDYINVFTIVFDQIGKWSNMPSKRGSIVRKQSSEITSTTKQLPNIASISKKTFDADWLALTNDWAIIANDMNKAVSIYVNGK
jgi:hypothetical protein